MAHDIEITNGQADIAYVAETPWHGLGQNLEEGQPIEVWAKAAGLAHQVHRSIVEYRDHEGDYQAYGDREVLYRSDNFKPLGVVGNNYNIVQPQTVLDFFARLAERNEFTLETAGALGGGKRIWALAKVSDGAPVIGQDVVKPYVLLATSYDGSMATVAKFTSVRVVCANTLGFAMNSGGDTVRVPHNKQFDITETQLDLGIAFNAFDKFLIDSRKLAKRQVNDTFAVEFLKMLLPPTVSVKTTAGIKTVTPVPVDETKAFKDIMALFKGEALGSDLPEAQGTAWQLLNATTQYVDHINGRNSDSRLSSAWFGVGNALKNKARDTLLEVV